MSGASEVRFSVASTLRPGSVGLISTTKHTRAQANDRGAPASRAAVQNPVPITAAGNDDPKRGQEGGGPGPSLQFVEVDMHRPGEQQVSEHETQHGGGEVDLPQHPSDHRPYTQSRRNPVQADQSQHGDQSDDQHRHRRRQARDPQVQPTDSGAEGQKDRGQVEQRKAHAPVLARDGGAINRNRIRLATFIWRLCPARAEPRCAEP